MLYHFSPVENKQSILEEGLRPQKNGMRKIYLGGSIYDAYLLAPPTETYCRLINLINASFNIWTGYAKKDYVISLFEVNEEELSYHESRAVDLSMVCNCLKIKYTQQNRILSEYTTDFVPVEAIKHIRDYNLPYYEMYKLDYESILQRQDECKKLSIEQGSLTKAIEIMKKKYCPSVIEMFVPEEEVFHPLETSAVTDNMHIEKAQYTVESFMIEVLESDSLSNIPEIRKLLSSKYKDVLLWQYSNFREGIIYKSLIHGKEHVERVMLLGALIAMFRKLSLDDARMLLVACAYHDIGRINDKYDTAHGKRSADMLMNLPMITDNVSDKTILFAMVAAHSCPDDTIDYFMDYYKVKKDKRTKCKKLYYMLKDADNLDRVRIYDLDENYLRDPSSKALADVAKKLFKIYPSQKYYEGMLCMNGIMEKLKLQYS